ncbi:MAG TPA: hypothetical protein PLG17_09975, partial [Thermodesulfobacteriota bacterium]|nr:hypothetical protein [Thermodesulfobacteriota bacterium]
RVAATYEQRSDAHFVGSRSVISVSIGCTLDSRLRGNDIMGLLSNLYKFINTDEMVKDHYK